MTCYQNMTAKELHDLVTRLEAHGFKLPEGVAFDRHHAWTTHGVEIHAPFAAAIIEVAARDWWLGSRDAIISSHAYGETYADDFDAAGPATKGPTPLHAILAATEHLESNAP